MDLHSSLTGVHGLKQLYNTETSAWVTPDAVRHVETILVAENSQLVWPIVLPEAVNSFIVIVSLHNHRHLLLLLLAVITFLHAFQLFIQNTQQYIEFSYQHTVRLLFSLATPITARRFLLSSGIVYKTLTYLLTKHKYSTNDKPLSINVRTKTERDCRVCRRTVIFDWPSSQEYGRDLTAHRSHHCVYLQHVPACTVMVTWRQN